MRGLVLSALAFLSVLFLLTTISAITINEVEINPSGGSSGKEWVEFYNDNENDLDSSGWEVWEGVSGTSGPKKILVVDNGTVIPKNSFYTIELNGSKLNNGGDFVILYDSSKTKIDETETLKDTTSGIETWQLCEGEWKFLEATKDSENVCPGPVEENTTETTTENVTVVHDNTTADNTTTEKTTTNTNSGINVNVKTDLNVGGLAIKDTGLDVINLNSKDIKTEDDNENLSRNNYAVYGFVVFSIVLGVLFLIKSNRYKNEFR